MEKNKQRRENMLAKKLHEVEVEEDREEGADECLFCKGTLS